MSSISGLQGARNPGASECEPRDKDERIRGVKWRRGWDLNPRYPLRYVRFRGGSFQPLTHLSASDNREISAHLHFIRWIIYGIIEDFAWIGLQTAAISGTVEGGCPHT